MKKVIGLIAWTGVLSVVFLCIGLIGLIAITRAATPRGAGRPLALAETPNVEAVAKRVERKVDMSNETLSKQIDVLSQRVDALMSGHDLLKKDFDAFRKDTDCRFAKQIDPPAVAEADPVIPEIHGFTPSWFVCAACPRVKRESEADGLPFKVVWSEVTEEQLKALGIPEKVGFPCFYWTDSLHNGWYFWNGSSREPTMKALEAKWREHR